ncbi:MAG: phosphoadenosine phosphosulfate reductase [Frankiaceae bacterium]|nr:phosphoadenosine phosphosulfate reductase [Frankiaceae bacterium]MDQ1673609.1 phosphoadenosine phosphosulfate reductase [Frankiaceae bacterium]
MSITADVRPAAYSARGFTDLTDLTPRELAERAGYELEGAPPIEVLRWAIDRFSPNFAITASMQDTVLVHMASKVRPGVPVIFLDTGYHFAETIGTADAAESVYGLNLLRIRPKLTVAQQDEAYGPRLYERDPDLCCGMRKVQPLQEAMRPYVAWATGLRRDEAESRQSARLVEWDEKKNRVKVNPLVAWSDEQIEAYIAENGVLMNPLLSEGYGSVGCEPCTLKGLGRSGRWANQNKTECGLHV